jgi:hypothetical protein
MIKMIPKTGQGQYEEYELRRCLLTVELDKIMRERLDQASAGSLLLCIAGLASFAVHEEHERHRGNTASNKDDGESTESPTPTGTSQKHRGELGSSKGRSDPGCFVDTVDDHAILQ